MATAAATTTTTTRGAGEGPLRRLSRSESALGWAGCFAVNDGTVRRMVLLSAVGDSVAHEPREADIERLRAARGRFSDMGLLVVDWLQCDGHVARSIDLASDGEGWRLAAALA